MPRVPKDLIFIGFRIVAMRIVFWGQGTWTLRDRVCSGFWGVPGFRRRPNPVVEDACCLNPGVWASLRVWGSRGCKA